MPIVELRDGSRIEVPDDLTREEQAWLTANRKLDTPLDVQQSIGSGLLEGALRGPLFVGDLGNLAVRGINKLLPGTIDPEYEKFTSDRAVEIAEELSGVKRHQPQTTAGRYAGAGASGVGGSMGIAPASAAGSMSRMGTTLPGAVNSAGHAASRVLANPTLMAAPVGMAAEAGSDLGGSGGAVAGGVGSQIAAALLARQLRPNHPDWIQEGTRGMTPEDWAQAERSRQALESAGARSATLVDSMPENSRLRGMTRDLSNTTGAGPLAEKLTSRMSPGQQELVNGQLVLRNQGDIPRLMDEAAEALVPGGVNAGQVTNTVAQGANRMMGDARQRRFDAYMPILEQGAPVHRREIANILAQLQARARDPRNAGTVDHFAADAATRTLQRTPLYPMARPGPQGAPTSQLPSVLGRAPSADVQPNWAFSGEMPPMPDMGANLVALSKNIKDLRNGVPSAGMDINRAAGFQAYQMADQALKEASPDYARAMGVYGDMTQSQVNPLREGLVGQLAKLEGRPPSENTLPNVLARSPQNETRQYLPQVAPEQSLRQQIARMIADAHPQPLRASGAGADRTMQARQTIMDLVTPESGATYASKTGAADTLSRLTAEAGADATARQNLSRSGLATVFAPFLELRNRLRLRMSEQETAVLSNLLANPTAENMATLRAIASERPDLGRAIATMQRMGGAAGAIQSTGE